MCQQEEIGAFPLLPKPAHEESFGKFLHKRIDLRSKKAHLAKAMRREVPR